MSKPNNISEATLRRVRDYAINEPSFTCAFAVWDLMRDGGKPITATSVKYAVVWMLERGIVELVEDNGRAGKVYAYVPPKPGATPRRFPELDDSRIAGVGVEAVQRGVIVPHTRSEGPSGKPGRDKARSARGVRVKRQRQGT